MRHVAPILGAILAVALIVLPAAAALPDSLGDLQKGSFVATDASQGNGAPGMRVVAVSATGGTNQVDLTKIGGNAVSAGATNQTVLTGFLDVMGGRQFVSTDTTVSPTLTDWVGSVGALSYGVYNATKPTLVTGNLGRAQLEANGALATSLYATTTVAGDSPLYMAGAAGGNLSTGRALAVALYQYDNATAAQVQTKAWRGVPDNQAGDAYLAVGVGLWNGAGADKARSSSIGTGILAAAPPDYSYLNIVAGQATTTVKSGAGFLHTICFNSAATATSTLVVYDNTAASGIVIARPAATTATVPTCMLYDLKFGTGLTLISAVANSSDMTVSYR